MHIFNSAILIVAGIPLGCTQVEASKKYFQQSIRLLLGISLTTQHSKRLEMTARLESASTPKPTSAAISQNYQLYKSKFMIAFNVLSIAASYQLPHKTTTETDTRTGLDNPLALARCRSHKRLGSRELIAIVMM